MALTPTSLFSCLISSALFTVLAWMLIKCDFTLKTVGRYISVLLAVIAIRMLLPVEFGFTITLSSRHILTELRDLLASGVHLGTYDFTIGEVLWFLWIAGAAAALMLRVVQYLCFSKMLGKCSGYFQHDMGTVIGRINERFGKDQHFQVLYAPEMCTPAIWGLMEPKILMPNNDYTDKDLDYILRHEMMHFYRRDILVKLLCEMLCIAYWWNPAAYLLRSLITRVIEINVDCRVTVGMSKEEKLEYLECIVKAMKKGARAKTRLMIMLVPYSKSCMMQRFHCVWENHWFDKGRKGIFIALISCLLFLASLSFIMEADYGSDIPGTFDCPEPETSYLLKSDRGYEIYVEDEWVGWCKELTEPFTELEVYEEKENFTNEE